MEHEEEILQSNVIEYLESAEQALKEKKYNAASTLFFKAICAAVDLFLLKEEGTVPSSHTDRSRTAQQHYPWIYDILDRDFPFYQDSYTKKMDLEAVEVLKEDAEAITKKISPRKKR
ncbi:hypothetical protein J4417_02720 [Candidatus Woesearchaeota archaeon]|nr:hypothetical protein [Candidatus Woesearchaeota archaeon]